MLREERFFLNHSAAICLGLALPAVVLGSAILYLLLGLGLILGLLATKGRSLRSTANMLLDSRIFWLCVVWLGVLYISAWQGINPAYSIEKAHQTLLLGIGSLLLFSVLREMPTRFVNIGLQSMLSGTLFLMLLAVIDAFADSVRFSTVLHGFDMAETPYRLNYYSSVFALALPFLWAFLYRNLQNREGIARLTTPFLLITTTMAVIICGGRAGWVALIAGMIIFILGAQRTHGFRVKFSHVVYGVLTYVAGVLAYGLAHGLTFLAQRLELEVVGRGLASGRFEIWDTALNAIPQYWLWGIGPNAFRFLDGPIDAHPHNATLQIALETGLIGGICALAFLYLVLRLFVRYARGNLYGLAGLTSFIVFLVAAQFNKSLFDAEWTSLLVILLLFGWRLGWSNQPHGTRKENQILPTSFFLNRDKPSS